MTKLFEGINNFLMLVISLVLGVLAVCYYKAKDDKRGIKKVVNSLSDMSPAERFDMLKRLMRK